MNKEKRRKKNLVKNVFSVTYNFKIVGETPIILHNSGGDREKLKSWLSENKKSVEDNLVKNNLAYDDRVPPWTWHYCFYVPDKNCENIVIPFYLIEAALNSAAYIMYQSRSVQYNTFSKFYFSKPYYDLLINGYPVKLENIINYRVSYEEQKKIASNYGIELFEAMIPKQQKVGFRVRPRIKNWAINGEVTIYFNLTKSVENNEEIDQYVDELFKLAGSRCGLGDWRPSSPKKPGIHGKFTAKLSRK